MATAGLGLAVAIVMNTVVFSYPADSSIALLGSEIVITNAGSFKCGKCQTDAQACTQMHESLASIEAVMLQ